MNRGYACSLVALMTAERDSLHVLMCNIRIDHLTGTNDLRECTALGVNPAWHIQHVRERDIESTLAERGVVCRIHVAARVQRPRVGGMRSRRSTDKQKNNHPHSGEQRRPTLKA